MIREYYKRKNEVIFLIDIILKIYYYKVTMKYKEKENWMKNMKLDAHSFYNFVFGFVGTDS